MEGRDGFRVTEPIRVWTVRVRALRPKYRIGGELVRVGFEHDLSLGEARDMERRGLVEIVGTPRLESTGIVAAIPPRERTRW